MFVVCLLLVTVIDIIKLFDPLFLSWSPERCHYWRVSQRFGALHHPVVAASIHALAAMGQGHPYPAFPVESGVRPTTAATISNRKWKYQVGVEPKGKRWHLLPLIFCYCLCVVCLVIGHVPGPDDNTACNIHDNSSNNNSSKQASPALAAGTL